MPRAYEDGGDLGDDTFGEELDAFLRKGWEDGTAVMYGCAPSAGSGDSVDVDSGLVAVNGSLADVGGGNVTLSARSDFNRLDLVVADDLGSLSSVTGSSELRAPGLSGTQVLIAVVLVPQSGSGLPITVYDARPIFDRLYGDSVSASSANVRDGRSGNTATLYTDILNAQSALELPQLSSDPASGDLDAGEIWINTTDDALKYWNAGASAIETIPTFDPANCQNPIVRVNLPTAGVVATEGVDPSIAGFPHLRYATSSGVLALHDQTAGRTSGAIDDFEDGDITEYSGGTGSFSVSSTTVYEGTYALHGSTTGYNSAEILSESGLPRYPKAGDTFDCRIRCDSGSGYFKWAMQSGNGYSVELKFDQTPSFILRREDSGGATTLASSSPSLSFSTWYRVKIEWGEGGSITVTVYDDTGTQVDQLSATDSTYTEGGIGWAVNGTGSGGDGHFDIAQITATTSGTGVIDDYEDGDISEYDTYDPGAGTGAQTGTVHSGTYALQIENSTGVDTDIISMSGLPRYPQAGDTFEGWTRIDADGTIRVGFAVQSSGKGTDRYMLDLRVANDDIRLVERVGGSSTVLGSAAVTLNINTWYRYVVDWGTDGSMTYTLYDSSGTQLAQVSGTDTNFTGGGIAPEIAAGGGISAYHDDIQITSTSDTQAAGPIDDFEDQDMAEYTEYPSTSGVSYAVDGTAPVHSGSYSLKVTDSNDGNDYNFVSLSGLDRYPEPGDTFECHVQLPGDNTYQFFELAFAVQSDADAPDRYRINLHDNADLFQIKKYSGGSDTGLASTSVTWSNYKNEWIRVVVEWTGSGGITATAYDSAGNQIASINATDTTFTSGGIYVGVNNTNNSTTSQTTYAIDDLNIL